MSPSLTIGEVIETGEFWRLKEGWNALLAISPGNNVFLTWEWLYTWWKVYGGKSKRLWILAVRENGQLVGLAPLFVETGRFGFATVRFLGTNIVCSDCLDFILMGEREGEILALILSFIEENSERWDRICLTDIPSHSKSVSVVTDYFRAYRMDLNPKYSVCPYLDLTGSLESISDSYTPFLKATLKRKMKKAEKDGGLKFLVINGHMDFDYYFEEFLRLNKLRRAQKDISPFQDRDFLAFHKQILDVFLPKGMAKLLLLKIGDSVVAAMYLFVFNKRYYYYQSGFDPDWHRLSPGTLLFNHCIKSAYQDGMTEFDFLRGNEAYKDYWTKTKRYNASVVVFNRTLWGYWASLQLSLEKRLRNLARSMVRQSKRNGAS